MEFLKVKQNINKTSRPQKMHTSNLYNLNQKKTLMQLKFTTILQLQEATTATACC